MRESRDKAEYFFNTETRMVEKGRLSSWEHLLGPYATFADAASALDTAAKRSDAWDDEDAALRGDSD